MNCENGLIKSWNVNGFDVRLFCNEDYLGYLTLNTKTNEIVDKGSFEVDLQKLKKSPKEMLACLEKCRIVLTENNKTLFGQILAQYNLGDKKVYLLEGSRDLVWDIFSNTTKESSFFSFIRSTVSSSRCHPQTVAYIEKIKEECVNDTRVADILMEDFKVVRLLDHEAHSKEYLEFQQDELAQDQYINQLDNIRNIVTSLAGPSLNIATRLSCRSNQPTNFFGSCIVLMLAPFEPFVNLFNVAVVLPALSISSTALRNYKSQALKRKGNLSDKCLILEKTRQIIDNHISTVFLEKPLIIEIEPITARSAIDERVLVSKFTWAVTLVSHDGKTFHGGKPYEISYGNHAQIYIEGINDGFYNEESLLIGKAKLVKTGEKFIHLAHYLPRIESGLHSSDELVFEKRTEIWMITSDKVKTMLQNIELEKTLPQGQRHEYNMLGEGSFVGKKGHNCFTWARYHLKTIDIDLKEKELPPSLTGFVAELVTDYTKKPTKYIEAPIQRI